MPLDGCFLYKLKNELCSILVGARVDKIYQPSRDELVFSVRTHNGNRKLLISSAVSAPRVGFIDKTPENPMQPPMFCMLLRKHLSGAKLIDIKQDKLERILQFCFESKNEMGDSIYPSIFVELIGNQTNIILCDQNLKIIDCVKKSDVENSSRLVLPGAKYSFPDTRFKLSVLDDALENIIASVKTDYGLLSNALLNILSGVSPIVCREICFSAYGDEGVLIENIQDFSPLLTELENLKRNLETAFGGYILQKDKTNKDFCFLKIHQYGQDFSNQHFESLSDVLDVFYNERTKAQRISGISSELKKALVNAKNRAERKINARKMDLKKCENREVYRIFGELLKANIYSIPKGSSEAVVQNYYDENLENVKIKLNPALTVADNAGKYFKEYKKKCVASVTLVDLIEKSEQELFYIESMLDALSRAETVEELNIIKEEAALSGYIKRAARQLKRHSGALKPLEFTSPDGFRVLVGRNNRQNDELTLKIADKTDFWFHTKNIPGSHVIVLTEGKDLPETTVIFAAQKAAQFSKAKNSSNVPVDMVQIKYVKKPSGAKFGMVIFTNNRTLFVTP